MKPDVLWVAHTQPTDATDVAAWRITMITRMSNGWYLFDEHEVPRIIDALLVAGEQRLPHWFFVHGRNHITLQYLRRGMSILAPPDVWDAYTDLFNMGDGEVIAGRLDRLGWRRRPSYGFTGPGAAVTIMSSAVMGSELWLDIRGPSPPSCAPRSIH